MKFDASQFDNLELDTIGQWPAAAKLLLAIFLAVTIAFFGIYCINQRPDKGT
jgi:type IV pilus assembly protein PilO